MVTNTEGMIAGSVHCGAEGQSAVWRVPMSWYSVSVVTAGSDGDDADQGCVACLQLLQDH